AWAYHDWHQSGNGDTNSFMRTLTDKLGAPTSLNDFERMRGRITTGTSPVTATPTASCARLPTSWAHRPA
ncbi:hypothetical protein FQJ95_12285, partial [Xanthomonas vasicola]